MTVWVLTAIILSGHLFDSVVPTLEFSTKEKCLAAIKTFELDSRGKTGTSTLRCVRIEK